MGTSIRHMWEKLKSFLADDALFTAVLVVLVGMAAFGLGRHSVLSEQTAGVAVTAVPSSQPAVTVTQAVNPVSAPVSGRVVQVVASRSGSKYHLLDCPGAAQIKEENKVFFDSTSLAQAAGYGPAANCPGL